MIRESCLKERVLHTGDINEDVSEEDGGVGQIGDDDDRSHYEPRVQGA